MSSLDINSGKLVEWIVTRLKMNKDWSEKNSNIRQKISNALLDMPECEEIKQIIMGTYINYYHCVRILEILKTTECSSRNIFGQYSSKRIKDWQEIVRLYEQGNHYLVDCAQILNQNVWFEVPAVKKAIEKNNKTIQDSGRKEKDCIATVHEAMANLKRICTIYDIEVDPRREGCSDDIRAELRKSTVMLPSMINELREQIEVLREPFGIYKRYVHAIMDSNEEVVCPLIEYLLDRGNTTVYEWKHGVPPTMSSKCETMDAVVSDVVGDEIAWDIGIEETEEDFSMVDFGIEVEGESNGVRDNETGTLLEDLETRELLLDDLAELSEFFSSCIDEAKSRAGSLLDTIENVDYDSGRRHVTVDVAESMEARVATVTDVVTEKRLVHLLMVASSACYVETIVGRLERERSTVLKYSNLECLSRARAAEAVQDNDCQETRLAMLRRQCKDLKTNIESAISGYLGGNRVVRIVGEISTI